VRKGYLLAEAMIAVIVAGVLAGVFTTMNYYSHSQSNLLKQQNSKIILEVVRSRLVNLAQDPDSDQYFELLKEDENSTLPLEVGIGTDAWGKRIKYWTFDLGTPNEVNASYADNNTTAISPNTNVVGRLVSLGEDGIIETTATDAIAKGDDLMLEIGVGELNHYKLYGGSEIATQTRGYNSAIVSADAPASPINGTIWYDTSTSKLKIYTDSNNSWIIF
jgi:hypothetical protein